MHYPPLLITLALILTLSVPALAQDPAAPSPRERINFDAGWRFHLGDPADLGSGELDYSKLKDFLLATGNDLSKAPPVARPSGNPGGNVSFVQPSFDDGAWRQLNLPHDWAIEGPFDIKEAGETGKLPYWGQAWYRKHFALPAGDQGRCFFLEIDGAMSYSTVWVNGQIVGGWPYGYSSYQLDLTPYVKPGSDNTIAIRLDNPKESSRWYPGAGIYRHVWLTKNRSPPSRPLGNLSHHAGGLHFQRHGQSQHDTTKSGNGERTGRRCHLDLRARFPRPGGQRSRRHFSQRHLLRSRRADGECRNQNPACPSQALEHQNSSTLPGGDGGEAGRKDRRPLRNEVWPPHDPLRCRQRFLS